MRRLWGRANSVNVQKALWGLDESGLAYERVEAGGAHGVIADPAYRAMNPNGLVPVLQEDGFALWESNAILRYLADGAEGALRLPDDRRERAQVQQWLDWQATSFTPAMRDAATERRALQDALLDGLAAGEVALHYQPQIELASGRLRGVEALIRWNHPTRGLLAPAEFLPAIEASTLATRFGQWCLDEACRQAAAWRKA
ncbi:EAL domain-containing protein, partial [Methylobacterium sp. WL122]